MAKQTALKYITYIFLHSCSDLVRNFLIYVASAQAFNKAWAAVCGAAGDSAKLVIPEGKSFLVKQTTFKGPCKAANIIVEVHIKIHLK